MLQSNKSQVIGGRYQKVYLIRCASKELKVTYIIEKVYKKHGQIFQGYFIVNIKGPSIFQEKEQGLINSQLYYKRIIPLIYSQLCINPYLVFIQNRVLGYLVANTQRELQERGIRPVFQLPFLLDLNLIKTIQNKIKDYIGANYLDLDRGRQYIYSRLCNIIQEAQDSISIELLNELIDSMPNRCQAVIDAKGGYTKY